MKTTRLMLWSAAVVAAVGVTTAAVTLAGASDNNEVLSQDEVSRQLSDLSGTPTSDTTASPTATATDGSPSAPATDGVTKTLSSEAAQLTARCDGGLARLEAWSPNPGYRVDDVVRGPAAEAYLWIESDIYEDVMIFVRCEGGEPTMIEEVEQDDHGRNRGHD
jgi:hypothetical protein